MDVETETSTVVLGDLVAALEQATLMAKHLPTTTDPSQLLQIHTTLHSAHRHLSLFLSQNHPPPPPTHHPQPTGLPAPPPENSVSFAVGGGGDENGETGGGEPMQMGDDEDEQISRAATSVATVDKVEERMRECFIQNKRPKRRLSPSAAAAAEQRQSYENEAVAVEFDRLGTKLRSLDLIYQFHA
ncbi:hypothetical protein CDL12_11118 [Handroanthus impetiginosus]|uniref:Uncharacterized protein n=1 Tax=Handroanthus impetiginosus TaxID=429701 RepID=A0A2G9HFE0_9LAMI|nr:hypothetical protein CDL12_11118 [Handroanthus impetiginosus]